MIIIFDEERLEPLNDVKGFGYDYYHLPHSINGCNVVGIQYDEVSNEYGYHMGVLNEKREFEELDYFFGNQDKKVDLLMNNYMNY